MFSLDHPSGKLVTPSKKLKNGVNTVVLLRKTYTNSETLPAQALEKTVVNYFSTSRVDDDFNNIEKLMGRYTYFQDLKRQYGPQLFQNFCSYLYYRSESAGSIIIKADEEGQTFYVILSGTVGINVTRKRGPQKTTFEVNTLGQGESFGEAALFDAKTVTSATVIAKVNCEFACIDRKNFWDILGRLQQSEFFAKIKFLRELCFLKGWYEQDIKSLSYHFCANKHIKDHVVYRRGDACADLYFVKSGIVRLMGLVQCRKQQGDEFEQLMVNKAGAAKEVVICSLTSGAIFGDEGIVEEPRRYTAICSSLETEYYSITLADLKRRLWWEESREALRGLVIANQQWLQARLAEQQAFEDGKPLTNPRMKNKPTIQLRKNKLSIDVPVPSSCGESVRKTPRTRHEGVDFLTPTASLECSFTAPETARSDKQTLQPLSLFQRAKLLGLDRDLLSAKNRKRIAMGRQESFLRQCQLHGIQTDLTSFFANETVQTFKKAVSQQTSPIRSTITPRTPRSYPAGFGPRTTDSTKLSSLRSLDIPNVKVPPKTSAGQPRMSQQRLYSLC